MPRTLLIMQDFLPDLPGGIANYVQRICTDLAPDIEPLVPAYGDYQAFDARQPFPIHRRRIPIEPPAFMRESRWHWLRLPYVFYIVLAQFVLFAYHGWRVGRRRAVDLFLIGHLYLAPIGWVLARVCRRPFAVVLYGGELHRYWHWFFVRGPLLAALNRADFLIVITRFTQDHYIERGVRRDQRFVLVYPGVDTSRFRTELDDERFSERFGLDNKPTLLTVARLVDWKGHELVLRALPTVLQSVPDAHYLIAGSGPYRSTLNRTVEQMGLEQHVTFTGFVPDEELPELYNAADLFVQASREAEGGTAIEGFGITYLEASACGLPVIGGRTGGTGEAIADGISGLRVDPYNSEELAAAIVLLLQDQAYAHRLGRQGRTRAVAEFDWSIQTARLRRFLAETFGPASTGSGHSMVDEPVTDSSVGPQ